MITRFWMGRRRPGLSHEEFSAHWRGVHADVASRMPGLRHYTQNHVLPPTQGGLPHPRFDGCSELDFDDVASMRRTFASPQAEEANADEVRFADQHRFALAITERRVLVDGPRSELTVRLLSFLRANPAAGPASFLDACAGPYCDAVLATNPARYEQLIVVPDAHAQEVAPACDAVEAIWFRDVDDAQRYLASEGAGRAASELAGLAFGTERALVRPNIVIA